MKRKCSSRELAFLISIEKSLQDSLQLVVEQRAVEPFLSWRRTCHLPPLTLRLQGNRLNYRSAIALSLAGKEAHFAPQIAAEIIERLQRQIHPDFVQICCSPPAWVEFTLTENTVQTWLKEGIQAICAPLHSLSPPETVHSLTHYVRDRCCQLLQLGREEHLIALPSARLETFSLSESSLLQAEDWKFLYQLILTRDHLEKVSSRRTWEKLADDLSLAFLDFHQDCQLFNRKQPNFEQLIAIRFSAIAILERLLSILGD